MGKKTSSGKPLTGRATGVGRADAKLLVQLANLSIFFIAGTLKIAYDLLLYRGFVAIQPPEEMQR